MVNLPQCDRGAGIKFLNELGPRCSWTTVSPEQFAFYLHVDDGLVFGDGGRSAAVNKVVDAAADQLQDQGFKITDRQYDPELENIVGYTAVRHPARLELPGKRASLLGATLRWAVGQAWKDTGALRSIVGI